ncbi:MAG: IS21 family transposase [Paludibacter sp.]|nr:IS21 family transposase [Paludibacter sp.]
MTTLKIIIQGLSKGISRNTLSKQYHVSRNTIRAYEQKIRSLQLQFEEVLKLSDGELYALLRDNVHDPNEENERWQQLQEMLPYFKQELQKCGVTRQLLWQEYKTDNQQAYGYSQFCVQLSKYLDNNDLTMVLQHQYGDCMEVDFAGEKMRYCNPATGEIVEVPVLVCVLPASCYAYAEALPNAQQENVYAALNRSLQYFGGVPKNVLSDNMKQYVEKSSRYEPKFNELGEEWALHYGTNLTATRVRKPKDKPTVENTVYQLYTHVFAPLRNHKFNSIDELNQSLWSQLDKFLRTPFQRRAGSRHEDFINNERPVLQPIRPDSFQYKHVVEVTVQKNYHVYLGEDVHYYSVPYQYVKKRVKVIYDTEEVCIYLNMNQIAVHKRDYRRNGYSTYKEHMPIKHQKYMEQMGRDAEYFLSVMNKIGASSLEVTQRILASRNFPEQSYRACCGLISLLQHYGNERFENACHRSLCGSRITYSTIKNILKNNLDTQLSIDNPRDYIPHHNNVRGSNYYL